MSSIIVGKRKRYCVSEKEEKIDCLLNCICSSGYEEKWYFQKSNPHLEQCKESGIRHVEEKELTRILTHDANRLPYKRRQDEAKSVVH